MSSAAGSLVVFGSINQDITLEVGNFPEPGQTIMATGSTRAIGGKGANQAMAAALSGARTIMLGAVGEDSAGRLALRTLEQAGVETGSVLQHSDAPTGAAYICVRSDGENTIVVEPGANNLLRAEAFTGEKQHGESWCLLSLEVPEPEALAYAVAAKAKGARLALNASPSLSAELPAGLIDLLIVNEVEIASLVGPGWRAVGNLAEELGLQAVLVTQGAAGVRVDRSGEPSVDIAAIPVTLRDTTGCGDAFAGVVLSRLTAGSDYVSAVKAAVVYAGHVAEFPGAAASYHQAFAAAGREG